MSVIHSRCVTSVAFSWKARVRVTGCILSSLLRPGSPVGLPIENSPAGTRT